MIYFSKNLSILRSKKKMTLAQLSKELDLSISQWSNYEQGISFPKFKDLIKISEYFNISETDLIHSDLINKTLENEKNDIEKLKDEIIEIQRKIINSLEDKITYLSN